ncbi:alpha-amylase family glycosyl hydrolase [Altererythrobacter sp. KTW20L]|uniref:alpha-amylase family glycosyl hydrolase n=1 Tax=Altererythrobacter sp. KTW20L TaxID=2942210 RepID=UPI0020BFFD8E|nr:alpha-amylase family glycosyl hydrolase [Altererythrobacter sp. KTW20L]MCL6251654.1 alpha-amylase family glycosyl hydrolase [Altererythrobacter sp. KTW20L]
MLAPHPVPSANPAVPWWRGAAIYQIYPRSFQDSNGDGVGDLAGITRRLDHVADLGVDAIWISPFFTSPMKDFGYDISDYCAVDPVFGTLADFDALVARAHHLGLKVLIDQVYAHTSDQHEWFADSRATSDKADWYVWADPKADGTPPSNWQSVFGGPAWTWDARRCQYYLHTFLKEQPQLNVHNVAVQDALLDVAKFWLDRGVDGFRLDALNHAMADPLLRDNPPAPEVPGQRRTRPFDYQDKVHSQSQPEMVYFTERLRGLANEYGAVFTMAEVGGSNALEEMKAFTLGENRLDSAYGFDFLYAPALTPDLVATAMAEWPGDSGEGWPSWAFENHDAPRAVSRWCAAEDIDNFASLKMALLLCLRGNPILYQGEELGLEQDDIPFHLLQDPEAIANWPLTLSRDGARTPFPWTDDERGGFTTGTPWLPLSPANRARAAVVQSAAPFSMLKATRRLLALRRAHAELRLGRFELLEATQNLLVFRRTLPQGAVLCAFNLGQVDAAMPVDTAGMTLLASINGGDSSELPGLSAWIGRTAG